MVDLVRRALHLLRPRPVHRGDRSDGCAYDRALEIGAGTGFFLLNLKQAGVLRDGSVTDISPGMVAAAQRNASALGFAIEGRVADAESLPYPDESFDLVVGHAVLHHIPDVELAFRETLRVLRPAVGSCSAASRRGTATSSPVGCPG